MAVKICNNIICAKQTSNYNHDLNYEYLDESSRPGKIEFHTVVKSVNFKLYIKKSIRLQHKYGLVLTFHFTCIRYKRQ